MVYLSDERKKCFNYYFVIFPILLASIAEKTSRRFYFVKSYFLFDIATKNSAKSIFPDLFLSIRLKKRRTYYF